MSDDEAYISELEEINESLREKIRDYEMLLENTWASSKTLNLIPEKDFWYTNNARQSDGKPLLTKVWNSILSLREYLIEQNKTHKIYIFPDQITGNLWTTFTDDMIEHSVKSKYRLRFCIVKR